MTDPRTSSFGRSIKHTAKDTNEKEIPVKKTPMKPTTAAGAKPKMRGNHKKVHKLSPAFASILGETHMIWNEACREIWRYIKENNLQDPDDKLMIKCDKKLEAMTKKSRVSGKEIPKIVTQHLTHDPDMEVENTDEESGSEEEEEEEEKEPDFITNGPKSDIESFLASWMLNDKSKNEAFLEALKCDIVLRD